MTNPPVFFEIIESADNAPLQVCKKIMAQLFKRKIAPLPYGSSVNDLRPMLATLRTRNTPPCIWIINTYWAEEALADLDKQIGQTPVLFFRRDLFAAGTSGLAPSVDIEQQMQERLNVALNAMTPRMHAVWRCPSCRFKTDCCGW